MATAQQIADVRFMINDTDANHYAFTDTEIGDTFDTEGSILRATRTLWELIEGSGDKLKKILMIDVNDGYSLDVAARIVERRLESLEASIIGEEEAESLYQEDDDRWKWNWREKLADMIS